jgi:hypothetical protein
MAASATRWFGEGTKSSIKSISQEHCGRHTGSHEI